MRTQTSRDRAGSPCVSQDHVLRATTPCAPAPGSTGVSPSAFPGDTRADPTRPSSDAGADLGALTRPPLPQPLRPVSTSAHLQYSATTQVATERERAIQMRQVQPDSLRHPTDTFTLEVLLPPAEGGGSQPSREAKPPASSVLPDSCHQPAHRQDSEGKSHGPAISSTTEPSGSSLRSLRPGQVHVRQGGSHRTRQLGTCPSRGPLVRKRQLGTPMSMSGSGASPQKRLGEPSGSERQLHWKTEE